MLITAKLIELSCFVNTFCNLLILCRLWTFTENSQIICRV